MTIRVSASALDAFYTCPARYALSRDFRPKEVKPWFTWGLEAHRLMEGKEVENPSRQGVKYFKGLKRVRDEMGYETLFSEFTQTVKLTDEIDLIRRIDLVAKLDEEVLLVDWKTASKPWKVVQMDGYVVAPKSMTFQAAAYVFPAGDEWDGPWPERIDFAVSSGQVFTYYRNPADETNLIRAAEELTQAVKRGIMVKHRGYPCEGCDLLDVCYETPGWTKKYTLRGG